MSTSIAPLLDRIEDAATRIGRPVRMMEVCGTHTHVAARMGLSSLLPPGVELLSGPGCPVCVTPAADIERCLWLAGQRDVIICTFGDMLRVPGHTSSLEQERATGADVRVIASPADALQIALQESDHTVVFPAVGFETTAPGVAAVVLEAQRRHVDNLHLLVVHRLVVPALEALLASGAAIDGFITPGHVSAIIGSNAYAPLAARHQVPCVVTGFDPADLVAGIAMLLEKIAAGDCGSFNAYERVVKPDGNPRARQVMFETFRTADAAWRGLGTIGQSGLALKAEFAAWDATQQFAIPVMSDEEPDGCQCGAVLKGVSAPSDCPLFGNQCTPRHPVGPCMVSSEGACAARYRYG